MRAARAASRSAIAALGHLRAAGMRDRGQHQRQPAQRAPTSRRSTSSCARTGIVVVAGPAHRAARPRRRSPRMLLQPWDLLDVVPRVAALKQRARADGILLMPGNNLGYFGPEEALLRSLARRRRGPLARLPGRPLRDGHRVRRRRQGLPVAADRALRRRQPARAAARRASGTTRPSSRFTRERTVDDLWGFCRTCAFADICLGGCTFTAHALFGRPGNNPYCHFRARIARERGLRERLVPREPRPRRRRSTTASSSSSPSRSTPPDLPPRARATW